MLVSRHDDGTAALRCLPSRWMRSIARPQLEAVEMLLTPADLGDGNVIAAL